MSEDAKHTALYEWGKIRNRNRPRAPSMAETVAFGEGFDAAMKFMAPPRIPCLHPTDPLQRQYYVPTPVHPGRDALAQRFVHVDCPECGGTGSIDSGGFDQQDRPINVGCPLCHGKPVTADQVRAAGWVSANEQPPKVDNPHGLVAFYTDAPVKPPLRPEPPCTLKGLGPSRMRLNGAIGAGILPAERVAHAAGIGAEFTARGFRDFKFGFDNDPERNRPWVECISPFTWEESTDNEEYVCRMVCAMNGTEYHIPACPKCGITFRQRHLAANREVTCSACGHQYQDPT